MLNKYLKFLAICVLGSALLGTAMAADSEALDGKWKGDREVDGSKVTYNLEFKKDTFRFELKNSNGEIQFVAKGKLKFEKLGPFKTVTLQDIEGGGSWDNLQPVDDSRAYVYATGWKTLTMAGNFDRMRDNEEPNLIVYRKE